MKGGKKRKGGNPSVQGKPAVNRKNREGNAMGRSGIKGDSSNVEFPDFVQKGGLFGPMALRYPAGKNTTKTGS